MNKQSNSTPFHEMNDEELLTLDEVAEILKTSANTVRWWRQQLASPDFFKIGKRLYTTACDVRAFVRRERLAAKPTLGRPKAV
jgi:hypothetical protein